MASVSTPPPTEAATQHLYQLATGYIVSSALYPVLKLKVADHMASGPCTSAELAQATGANRDALYRVMRMLASVGVFDETEPHLFALTPVGTLLRSDVPGSVHDLALWLCDPFHFQTYGELLHSLTTGKPSADKVVGMPVFEYLPRDPELSERFNNAMTGFSAAVIPGS